MSRLGLVSMFLFATLSGPACLPVPVSSSKPRASEEGSLADRYLDRFPAREMCAPSFPYRWWCPLAARPVPHLDLPSQATSYVGITAWVADGDRVQDALGRQTGLAVLHLGPSGAALVGLKSDDAEEHQAMVRAYVGAAMALEGRGDEVPVTEDLDDYIDGQRASMSLHPLLRADRVVGWTGDLKTCMWEASDGGWGRVLVVVEEAKGGMYVSLFPVVGLTVEPMPAVAESDDSPEGRAARAFAPHSGHAAAVVKKRRQAASASNHGSGSSGGGGAHPAKKGGQGGKRARAPQHHSR